MADVPGIRLHTGLVQFPGRPVSAIRYVIDPARFDGGLTVWAAGASDQNPRVHITTLEVASGGGKTTLANELNAFLLNEKDSSLFAWSAPMQLRFAIAMLPQRASTILHWRVRHILPNSSDFFAAFFPNVSLKSLENKHLSEMSGGEVARALLASALEALARRKGQSCYLILDEAFEGVAVDLANDMLRNLTTIWTAKDAPRLHVLMINHFDPTLLLSGVQARRLILTPAARKTEGAGKDTVAVQEVKIAEP